MIDYDYTNVNTEKLGDVIGAIRDGEVTHSQINDAFYKVGQFELLARNYIFSAMRGDLNAANQLHSHLIPGWSYLLRDTTPFYAAVSLNLGGNLPPINTKLPMFSARHDRLAVAWSIATLNGFLHDVFLIKTMAAA